jgi:hypothetical protein
MRKPPYLPFLASAPAFVVGLSPIEPAHWLVPDVAAAWLPEKSALIDARGSEVFEALPGSEPAQREAANLIAAALEHNLPATDEAPLLAASRLVSDDPVLLERREGGWIVTALSLASPTFFPAAHAIGKGLEALHEPVPDRLGPDQTKALGQRIGRVFDMLRDGLVLERMNWTVQAGPDRFTPSGEPLRARARAAPQSEAASLMHLRVERQTIRRLPETGAVLFNIRVAIDPLAPMLEDGDVRRGFAAAWGAAPAHVRAYKQWAACAHLVEALLSEV